MEAIHAAEAPAPAGHYSQAMIHDGLVYVSGQLPINPERPTESPKDIEGQTERTLRNVEAVLRAAGVTLGRNYPQPMVDLGESRKQALAAYEKIRAA